MSQVNYMQVLCSCNELSEPYLEETPCELSCGGLDKNGNAFYRKGYYTIKTWRCKRCGELVVEPENRK